jgi:RNA polymerase sigma factor (sigma-70 family)
MSESLPMTSEDFEAFYDRNYRMVYRICFTYMKNAHDAEDSTEDVFVKVLTGNYAFEDDEHEKKWLTVVAINLCKDRLKHWWRKATISIDDCGELQANDSFEIDETLSIVMTLPPKYKDVIYLHYYEGYQTNQIATMLKRNPSTVRNQLRDARAILKEKLGGVRR